MEPTPTPTPTPTPMPTTNPTPDPTPLDPPTKPAKPKVNILPILLVSLVVLLLAAGGYFYYQNSLLQKQVNEMKTATTPSPSPVASASASPSPLTSPNPTAAPGNLETYTDPTYKFEITFPKNYKVEPDHYGWPKAALILYSGGQSYDLVVEVWDTKAEYEAKYQNMMDTITVVQSQSTKKYFTLNNANKDPEVTQIISTFKVD